MSADPTLPDDDRVSSTTRPLVTLFPEPVGVLIVHDA